MNKYIFTILLCALLPNTAWTYTTDDLQLLDRELARKTQYDANKINRILMIHAGNLPRYEQLELLFDEYKSYNYDTAYIYTTKLLDEAQMMGSRERTDEARLKQAFIYLSSGLFHESLTVFESITPKLLDPSNRDDYYTNYARLYYDMGDYAHGTLKYDYIAKGNELSKQALRCLSPNDTVRYWSTSGLYHMKMNDYIHALEHFKLALSASTISDHERAIAYSSMAHIYQMREQKTEADHFWVMAAIADLRSSTKETVAMAIVAEQLYEDGDIDRAATYIRAAMDDAAFYNARHRQIAVGKILPIIENKQVQDLQQKNQRIERLSSWLYIVLALLLATLVVLANRIRAIHKAHGTIKTMNAGLMEANHIKEEYIGTSYRNMSDLLSRLEKYERYVHRKAMDKQTDELQIIPSYIDAHRCRKDFYKQFDESFIRIFPHFVQHFNALLSDGEAMEVKPGEILSTELRIFALIRLGITDNEQISKVLDYSINTIYTYKTRVRNRSQLSNEDFQRAVMAIPSF